MRYYDGGGCRFSGPPMVTGDSSACPGESIWYRCEACQDWFLIPPSYTVIIEDEDLFAV
jgi:hypothetical protein